METGAMTLLNGHPAATFMQTLVCIQIGSLFVQVCLCECAGRLCASRPRTYFSLSWMASICFGWALSLWIHVRASIGLSTWCLRTLRRHRYGFALTCTHTGIHTSQGVNLQIGFSPAAWQSWQALYERNKQGSFTSLPPLPPSIQLKASNLLLNWWT